MKRARGTSHAACRRRRSVATGAYNPRPTVTATTCAVPSHRTAPAAYDAKIPGTASPGVVSIHARASKRRTPSTNTTVAGAVVPGGGRRGAPLIARNFEIGNDLRFGLWEVRFET